MGERARGIRWVYGARPASLAALLALVAAGCGASVVDRGFEATSAARQPREDLDLALSFLDALEDYAPEEADRQTQISLNSWLKAQRGPEDWRPDPILERTPRAIRQHTRALRELELLEFSRQDIDYLREVVWLRNIAGWAGRLNRDPALAARLAWIDRALPPAEAEQLRAALLLFDWTVRNVQPAPLLERKREVAGAPAQGVSEARAAEPPARRGVIGPGYARLPWHALFHGEGDAWLRARVFILLARQARVDVVLLAFDEGEVEPPRVWLPAAVVGAELYLFDPTLGFPIPGPGGDDIATLAQTRAQPELLTNLRLPDEPPPTHLAYNDEKLIGLIDGAPEALSLRFKLLENALTGARRLGLTVSPVELGKRLAKTPAFGARPLRLWDAPFEAHMFREFLHEAAGRDPMAARLLASEELLARQPHPYSQARHLHFHGRFDVEDGKPGAKARYMEIRVPEEQLRRMPGLQPAHLGQIREFKARASLGLGIALHEEQAYDAAIDWLERARSAPASTPWLVGVHYNLARAHEARGELEKAREILLKDTSPQALGNKLRARWLETQAAPPTSAR